MTHPVSFRAEEELSEKVEELADERDISNSEAWRSLTKYALANGGADAIEHVEWKAILEQIKEESYKEKREAWFRSNVGGRLLKAFNSGLSPTEAEKDMATYYREARELHDSGEFVQYVDEALSVYADAYARDRSAMLRDWVKARDADLSEMPDDVADDPAEENVAEDAEPVGESEQRTREERIEDAADWVERDILTIDNVDEEIRDEVRDRVEGDDG